MKPAQLISLYLFVVLTGTLGLPMAATAEPVELDGLIEPFLIVKVGSAVPGILESVKVDRGDLVKKGQVLALNTNVH